MKSKVVKVLVLLLVVVCILCGCTQAKHEYGFSPTHDVKQIRIGVKYNNDTFAKDDVTFDLYYGFYDIKWKQDSTSMSSRFAGRDEFFFAMYIANSDFIYATFRDVYDYKNIENMLFIKEFSHEEVQADEYAFRVGLFSIRYNHQERFTVPQEIFDSDVGYFEILICAFEKKTASDLKYKYPTSCSVMFSYKILDDNTLHLSV